LPPDSASPPNAIRFNPLAAANFSLDTSALSPDDTLLHFVRLLRQRYQAVLAHTPADAPRVPFLRRQLPALALAEAFLRLGQLAQRGAGPLHIAVVGPTQAGKSSIVNCLCRQEAAQVSPLAGYTVHPQGFYLSTQSSALSTLSAWLDDYFSGFQRLPAGQLPHDRYDCYALADLPAVDTALPEAVIWDTPDFDSIDAEGYREGVLRTAALADVLLVVLSKDKYADQSVWDILQLLAPLQQPTVLCLNKIAEDSRELVENSLRRRWEELRGDGVPPIVSLPYRQDWGPAARHSLDGALFTTLNQAAGRVARGQHGQNARRLLTGHWDSWLEPVRGEQNAWATWNREVESAVRNAEQRYQRDYLDHPQHYETFQRTLVELLTLLEIPGIAKPLHYARQAVTWPLRQVARLGQWAGSGKAPPAGSETLVLEQTMEHLLLHLAEGVLQQREQDSRRHGWWNELGRLLQQRRPAQQQALRAAIQQYQLAFQVEIDAAAQRLLDKLREHPAVLNSLRATRAGADAASLALMFHLGGIGLHDVLLAPAMLSITSLLAESALGSYLHKEEAKLKQRQREAVAALLRSQAEQHWLCLPEALDSADKFHIPAATIEAAGTALGSHGH
jgi:GTPase SAR1 family protein